MRLPGVLGVRGYTAPHLRLQLGDGTERFLLLLQHLFELLELTRHRPQLTRQRLLIVAQFLPELP